MARANRLYGRAGGARQGVRVVRHTRTEILAVNQGMTRLSN
jgi:hypothetical protein